jgi:hypothetical protein
MSKSRQCFCLTFAAVLIAAVSSFGAKPEIDVVVIQNGTKARVELAFMPEFGQTPRNISFIRSIAGITLPSARIESLETSLADRAVNSRKFATGEYVVAGDYDRIRYVVDLLPPENLLAMTHFSWFDGRRGAYMLRDLMPDLNRGASVRIRFEKTGAERLYSTVATGSDMTFSFADFRDSVIFADDSAEVSEFSVEGTRVLILKSGEWQTTTPKITGAAMKILGFYDSVIGDASPKSVVISLAKFPKGTPPGRWRAETRGGVVTILSSEASFQMQSEQKLMEQLRHELFHLWFPGSLNLTGNYDWFYEGFALYASLRAALELKQIRFDDFLDTISRAVKIDGAVRRRQSLIDASANRWTGGDLTVYARGLLVAFAVDVRMLHANGKTSVFDFLKRLSVEHGPASNPVEARQALSEAFAARPELAGIWRQAVEGADPIALSAEFGMTGLEVAEPNEGLRVKSRLTGREKDLLNKLGYNSWRKKTD